MHLLDLVQGAENYMVSWTGRKTKESKESEALIPQVKKGILCICWFVEGRAEEIGERVMSLGVFPITRGKNSPGMRETQETWV